MTTQNNSDDFSIHTMQDDLASVDKNLPQQSSTVQEIKESPLKTIQQDKPEFKAALTPKETTLPNTNPFFDQSFAAPATMTEKPKTENLNAAFASAQPNPMQNEKTETVPQMEITETQIPQNATSTNSTYKIVLILIFILTVSIIGLGGYYFWVTRTPQQAVIPVDAPAETTQEVIETPAVTIEPQTEKYSASKPNFLVLDLATLTMSDIKTSLGKTAEELKTASSQEPFEFIVVDANNNPVTFPIFSIAAGLNLSQKVLSSLGNEFSLFIYNDKGNMRTAASIAISNKDALTKELPTQEKSFSNDISFMFLEAKPDAVSGEFKTGSYNSTATRYLNLNKEETLSIDYAVTEKTLVIGTSKATLRAALDKASKEKVSTPITENIETETTSTVKPVVENDLVAFKKKFMTCIPTSYSDGNLYIYTIIGKKDSLCELSIKGLPDSKQTSLANKEMTCLLDTTQNHESAISEVSRNSCTGSLKSALIEIMK